MVFSLELITRPLCGRPMLSDIDEPLSIRICLPFHLSRHLHCCFGFLAHPLLLVDHRQSAMCLAEGGPYRRCLLILCDGIVQPSLLGVDRPQVEVCFNKVGTDFDCLLKFRDCGTQILLTSIDAAQVEV